MTVKDMFNAQLNTFTTHC